MSAKIELIAPLGALVIRLLGFSWKIQVADAHFLEDARAYSRNVLFAVWHGRLLPLSVSHHGRSIQVLASEHEDGELLGRAITYLGFGHVRGSSTRGGANAIRRLVGKLRDGFDVGITVDGPRGPRYEVKPGPVEIAKLAGVAIVPITTSSKRHKVFSSWDAFELPYPFTRVTVRYGEPVVVPQDAGADVLEEKRRLLENRLQEITRKNDELYRA